MEIVFSRVDKRENSTALPKGGKSIFGEMKGECSILEPVVKVRLDDITRYNYAYIKDFKRYYFVNDWKFSHGFWYVFLKVDVLGTYKQDILNSTQYVLRSSYDYNSDIIDTLYPTENNMVKKHQSIQFFDSPQLNKGTFIVGIMGSSSGLGVTYYSMDMATFSKVMKFLTSEPDYLKVDVSEISAELLKAVFNPMQYFTNAFFLPVSRGWVGGSLDNVKVGWWDTGIECMRINPDSYFTLTKSFTLPKHPQAPDRGRYLNGNPFSRYSITFLPFGNIVLDGTLLKDESTITIDLKVDIMTGDTNMIVKTGSGHIVAVASSNIASKIPVVQITQDGLGTLSSVTSVVGGVLSGDFIGAVKNVGNAISQAMPQTSIRGSQGNISISSEQCTLNSEFMTLVDEDIEDRGRPLMQKRKLSSLWGYVVVADSDIGIIGTKEEESMIKQFMEGGFFIE